MTWECPSCERRYPDSGIGLPMGYDAEDKSYCTQCAVHPDALRGLIDSKRNYVGAIPEPDELCERNKGYVEAVKTLCHELEQVIDDEA